MLHVFQGRGEEMTCQPQGRRPAKSICITMLMAVMSCAGGVMAEEYYVDPRGSDANPGSIDKPFRSIVRTQDEVRRSRALQKSPITVYLRGGTYYLDEAIVFSGEDSGSSNATVTYSAYEGEKAVISGGTRLSLDWRPYREGIFQAKTPDGLKVDQLFVNGKRQPMARYPNLQPKLLPYNGFAKDAFSRERAAGWSDPTGGFIHAMHSHLWGGYHYRITGKKSDHTVTYEGGWQNNRQMGMHESFRFVENIFEELDTPGEWFHDGRTHTLYYYPAEGVDVKTANVEVAGLRHLMEFRSTQEKPVRNISLKGLVFRHTARTFMETREPLLRSDWTIYRGGAVLFTGAEDCSIEACEFDQVGGNAVFVSGYNRRISVRETYIHGAGASGVCFVGGPDSVRNPLFEYNQRQSYEEIDKTRGPKNDHYPADCFVEDSLIHYVSVVEKQAAGIQISMSRGITVRHCTIYDVGRAGINISEGTFGGHLIEFCDVFDTVRETGDHGSFNSWGRDRFWHLENAPAEQLPDLAQLDTEKTVIRNSRWRCDQGWDVDLDDGSSCYEIYNNLFLRGGLKLREGFHRHVYNNIAVNNSLHPHVWYENSMDVITGNIWMTKYQPIRLNGWGKEIDRNLFLTEEDRDAYQAQGCDVHSIVGDPMFVDPTAGDYSVKDNSPALSVGFKNFPMDQFGVQAPKLKAMARTPVLPTPEFAEKEAEGTEVPVEQWLGATVAPLKGEEFSAFGVRRKDGGIHLIKVPSDSQAAKAGLQAGDLIQRVNGKAVKTVTDLREKAQTQGGKSLKIRFVREQKRQSLIIEP